MKGFLKVIAAVLFTIALFVTTAFLMTKYLLPKLPEPWQTDLIWVIAAVVATIAILAGLAEFTGYNLRTLFSKDEPESTSVAQVQDSRGAISIGAGDSTKIDWDGDLLQHGSTKIVVPDRNVVESQKDIEPPSTNLISEIQSELYGDNSRLPHRCVLICVIVSV